MDIRLSNSTVDAICHFSISPQPSHSNMVHIVSPIAIHAVRTSYVHFIRCDFCALASMIDFDLFFVQHLFTVVDDDDDFGPFASRVCVHNNNFRLLYWQQKYFTFSVSVVVMIMFDEINFISRTTSVGFIFIFV